MFVILRSGLCDEGPAFTCNGCYFQAQRVPILARILR